MEAFGGPSRCMTTEKFVGAYQEQTCYANCRDVVQKSSQSSEFEVILTFSTNQMNCVFLIMLVFSLFIMLVTTLNFNFSENVFFETSAHMPKVYKALVHSYFVCIISILLFIRKILTFVTTLWHSVYWHLILMKHFVGVTVSEKRVYTTRLHIWPCPNIG